MKEQDGGGGGEMDVDIDIDIDLDSDKKKEKKKKKEEEEVVEIETNLQTSRIEIYELILKGKISDAIRLVEESFNGILIEGLEIESSTTTIGGEGGETNRTEGGGREGGLLFELRLREFIEAVIHFNRQQQQQEEEELIPEEGTTTSTLSNAMDVDLSTTPFTPSTPTTTSTSTTTKSHLDILLELGQSLHSQYSNSNSTSIQSSLKTSFSLLAYNNSSSPSSPTTTTTSTTTLVTRSNEAVGTNELNWLLSQEARISLAEKVNSAILGIIFSSLFDFIPLFSRFSTNRNHFLLLLLFSSLVFSFLFFGARSISIETSYFGIRKFNKIYSG